MERCDIFYCDKSLHIVTSCDSYGLCRIIEDCDRWLHGYWFWLWQFYDRLYQGIKKHEFWQYLSTWNVNLWDICVWPITKLFSQGRKTATKTWNVPNFKLLNGHPIEPPNPEQHQKLKYTTKGGRNIVVYDNLFPEELLDHLRDHVLKYGVYYYDESTSDPTSDNVQWIAGFPLEEFVESPYWSILKEVWWVQGFDCLFIVKWGRKQDSGFPSHGEGEKKKVLIIPP